MLGLTLCYQQHKILSNFIYELVFLSGVWWDTGHVESRDARNSIPPFLASPPADGVHHLPRTQSPRGPTEQENSAGLKASARGH